VLNLASLVDILTLPSLVVLDQNAAWSGDIDGELVDSQSNIVGEAAKVVEVWRQSVGWLDRSFKGYTS